MSDERNGWQRFDLPSRSAATELLVDPFPAPPEPRERAPLPPFEVTGGPLRRLSPRKSWPEVAALDARMADLDRHRVQLGERIGRLEQAIRDAAMADKNALAEWQLTGGRGKRPAPTVPPLESELEQARADSDSCAIAEDRILREKVELVERNRKRLVKHAAQARRQAVEGLNEAILGVERARDEAVEALRAERWAREFPGEEADASSLRPAFMKGGRLSRAVPDIRTLTAAVSVLDWLRDDAAWFGSVLADEDEDKEPSVRKQAVWEASPEGEQAMRKEQERVRETLERNRNRGTRGAVWGDAE